MGNVSNADYPVSWKLKHSWSPPTHPAPNPFYYISRVESLSLNSVKYRR